MRHLRSAGFGILALSVTMAAPNALAQQDGTGTWAKMAPMRFARSEFQAAAVNGKIYVVGGGRADMPGKEAAEEAFGGFSKKL